ncbi:MAG: hypothetical protein JXB48_10985 [Candidatus Latescibacteria bacterium]|nr:hypothetical protein [Candidatus Latescibacterota bacterium]
MKLCKINESLMLQIPPDTYISFRESWINDLKTLPYEKFGDYIRRNIYSFFNSQDRSFWNKSTINNKELQEAIVGYLKQNKTQ